MIVKCAVGTHIASVASDVNSIVMLVALRAVELLVNGAVDAHTARIAHVKTFAHGAPLTFRAFQLVKTVLTVSAAWRTILNADFSTLGTQFAATMTFQAFAAVSAPLVGAIRALAALWAKVCIVTADSTARTMLLLAFGAFQTHMAAFAPRIGAVFADCLALLTYLHILMALIAVWTVQVLVNGTLKAHATVLADSERTFVATVALGATLMADARAQYVTLAAVRAGILTVNVALKTHIRTLVGALAATVATQTAVGTENIYIRFALAAVFAVFALIFGTFCTHMTVGANILAHTVSTAAALAAGSRVLALVAVALMTLSAGHSHVKMTLQAHLCVMVAAHAAATIKAPVADQTLLYVRKTTFALRTVVACLYGAIHTGPAGIAPLVYAVTAEITANANIAIIV